MNSVGRRRDKSFEITKTGHYAVAINKCQNFEGNIDLLNMWYTYRENPKKKVLKLDQQFVHSSKEKLFKFIKDAGIRDEELEEEIKLN